MEPRFPFGIPNGWYLMAYSDEVAAGQVLPLHYFERDFVAFRGESGSVAVFDAFCPHLGAHLGHGGRVVGDSLRCPFHGWRFDAAGDCVEIPYAARIPSRAKLRAHPTVERNGMIFTWWHENGDAPNYDVPDIAEWHDEGFVTPWLRYEWTVKTHPQEMAENGIDWPHFQSVHRMTMPEDRSHHFAEHVYTWSVGVSKDVSTLGDTPDDLFLAGENWGLGYSFIRQTGNQFNTIIATGMTPIDGETLHMRMGVIGEKLDDGDEATKQVLRTYIDEHRVVAEEDFPIFENKRFRPQPLLCEEDGPIPEFRRWAAQFYS
ncbi:MAG: Rieske 2Fe-2S domain-containing protein [Myxococcales bacterium]|nr:Rieske 2Fe-2S domain-containing protein [Myxococcales bacterium]